MIKMLKYMLISILLLTAVHAATQTTIDKVCVGSLRYYKVTGEPTSTYSWVITKPGGFEEAQLSDRDTVGIIWNQSPGYYMLSVVQHSENGCDAEVQLGRVEVFDHPAAFAGNDFVSCTGTAFPLSEATAQNYAAVTWTTTGDGIFSDNTLVNPVYSPGVNDLLNGNVTLTMLASGLGNSGTCQPAISTIHIYITPVNSMASSSPSSCSSAQNGSATITASGGTGPYTYTLNGNSNNTGLFFNLAAGFYSYTITDSGSCSVTGEIEVGNSAAIVSNSVFQNVDCFGAANGSIQLSGLSGGSGYYEFSIDNINWQSSPTFNGLIAGNYTVFVRDSLTPVCTTPVDTIQITEPEVLAAGVSHTNISLPGANDGTITITDPAGGSGQYEFSLDGITWQLSPVFTGLGAGNYLIYMRDALVNTCNRIIGAVMMGDGMTLSMIVKDASCTGRNDGEATVVVSGGNAPYTYSWNDPANQTTSTAFNLTAGIYTATVTDAIGVSLSITDTIHEPGIITPAFAAIGPICLNTSAPVLPGTSLNGIPGSWNPAVVNTASLGMTTYTFTPDTGQCADTISIQIEVSDGIVPVFGPMGPVCYQSVPPALPVVSQNGISGTWSPSMIRTDSLGTFTYTFIPGPSQCASTTNLLVTVSGPEIEEILEFTSTNGLLNGRAVIHATGTMPPFRYSLDGSSWQLSAEFTDLAAGTYTGWVMDSNGCTSSQQFTILNLVTGEVGLLAGDVESCISLPFEIPVLAYDFTEISAFSIQLQFDSTVVAFNGLTQVNQVLTNGNLTTTLLSPGTLQVTFTANDSISLTSEDLLFLLNFQGMAPGRSELKWQWLQCYIYSSAGYEIPAIYTKGSVMVRPAPLFKTEGSGKYCEGQELKLSASSYTSENYTYFWTDPQGYTYRGAEWDLGELSMNSSGRYYVKAYDSTACFRSTWLDVNVYPLPEVKLADFDTICAEESIVLTPGAGFTQYSWQDGSSEPQLVVTNEGSYWVVVTDLNGCIGSDTVLVHPCELVIWMPNAFSPNGDGLNDEFLAKYNLNVEITFQMIIYNKWGQEIFRSDDVRKGWDGTFKGVPCPPDLYTWTIGFRAPATYNFIQKSPMSGNVMLVK